MGAQPEMTVRTVVAIVAVLLLSGAYCDARAQGADIGTIEQRIEQVRPPAARPLPAAEAILTGKEDVVLLRRRKLFTLNVQPSYIYTTNAFLSDDRESSDHVFNGFATIRAATQIARRYDVFAEFGGFLSRYQDNPELDFDGILGTVGVDLPVDDWRVGLAYSGIGAFGRGFGDHLVTLHVLAASLRRVFPLTRATAVVPQLAVSRVWADPDDFSTVTVRGGATVIYRVTEKLAAVAGAQIHARVYDDFIEETTGESREDYGIAGQLALRWTPLETVSLSAFVSGTAVDSTVDANEYTSFTASPSLRLSIRF